MNSQGVACTQRSLILDTYRRGEKGGRNMSAVIQAKMLGEFTLCQVGKGEPQTVSLVGRSRRLWTLVAYLILYRERGVSTQELIELLWPGDDKVNPASTLQNNVSRARSALADMGFERAKSLISYESGYYKWAPGWDTYLDVQDFEMLSKKALSCPDRTEAIALGEKAIGLYAGDFLPEVATELWCVNLNAYYRSVYIRICRETVRWLFEEDRTDEIVKICTSVTKLDPTAEEFSVYLMRALTRRGQPQKAMEHYEYIRQIYRDTYGLTPSAALEMEKTSAVEELYGQDVGADEIRKFLLGGSRESGAFCCDNNVFREIVNLHLRAMQRDRTPAQLMVMRLQQKELDQEHRAIYMRQMETTLQNSLRAGDPFTRVGAGQFWILLPGAAPENGSTVMDRVIERLRQEFPKTEARFGFNIIDLRSLKAK